MPRSAAPSLEICTETPAGAAAAQAGGAHRIELCAELAVGGLTPSQGMIRRVREVLNSSLLHVMIRPRAGDFVYTDDEIKVMCYDIEAAGKLGADGVVFGSLHPDGRVQLEHTRLLCSLAQSQGMDVTFHRAFDMSKDLRESLEDLIAVGVPRVLTSGGCSSAMQGMEALRALALQAGGRIEVMAGCGVTAANVFRLMQATGVVAVHASARRQHGSGMEYRKPGMSMSSADLSGDDYSRLVTDGGTVQAILAEAVRYGEELMRSA